MRKFYIVSTERERGLERKWPEMKGVAFPVSLGQRGFM